MKRFTCLLLLVLLLAGMVQGATTATLAPATQKQFAVPMDDGSTASAVLFAAGNDQFLFVYASNGNLLWGTLTLDGKKIDPPVPPPPPPPPPVPPVGKIWGLVIIHESGTDTPEQGRIISSKIISKYCELNKWRKWTPDKDVVDEKNKPVVAAYVARAKTLPYFFIVDEKGAVAQEGSLPSESNLLGILQKIGGDSK